VALVRIQNAGLKCAARGSLNIQDAKIRHLRTIAQLCRAISLQLRHYDDCRQSEKKLGKQQYLLHNASHNMVNVGSQLRSVGECGVPPANFNGFRVLVSLLHQRRSAEVNKTLHDVWRFPGLVHGVYILGALAP